jgi:hypothetical protein
MLRGDDVALWPVISIFALGAGLSVESSSPDALCPPPEETRRAVAARLGGVELDGTWRASYGLVHRTEGDFVSLQLFDPGGVLRLERQLPVTTGSCAALSGVIALVLERFFLKPEASGAQEEEAPTTTPSTPGERASAPATATPAPVRAPQPSRAVDAAPQPATSPRPRFRVGAELWAATGWLAPTLHVDRRVFGPYRVALSAGFDLQSHQTAAFDDQGTIKLQRAPFALTVMRDFSLMPALSFSAGVDLFGMLEGAQTTGLVKSDDGLRVVPGIGARLGLWLFPETVAAPFAELAAAWLIKAAAPKFQIGKREVAAPPALVLGIALGISTPF